MAIELGLDQLKVLVANHERLGGTDGRYTPRRWVK